MKIIEKLKNLLFSIKDKAKKLNDSDAAKLAKNKITKKSKEAYTWLKNNLKIKSTPNIKKGLSSVKNKAKELNDSEAAKLAKDKIREKSKETYTWLKNNQKIKSAANWTRLNPLKFLGIVLAVSLSIFFLSKNAEIDLSKVHDFDIVSADPDDSKRVSKGIPLGEIIPFTAKKMGEEAVRENPKHPRLIHQLARVYEASNEFEKAIEYYQKASDLDYVISKVRLADFYASGRHVKVDIEKTKKLLTEAKKSGSTLAAKNLERYFFSSDGFSYPEDFLAIYTGKFSEITLSKGDLIMHLYNFVIGMQKIEGCPQLLSNKGSLVLDQKGTQVGFGKILGMIANSRRSAPSSRGRGIDYAGSFSQGMKEGNAVALEAANQGAAAENDIVIFWHKYGADSRVAKQMFLQMDRFIQGLDGVGFMSELEKNMYGK